MRPCTGAHLPTAKGWQLARPDESFDAELCWALFLDGQLAAAYAACRDALVFAPSHTSSCKNDSTALGGEALP